MRFPLAPPGGVVHHRGAGQRTTLAGAAIGSWRGGSANRARRVGRSLILADLVDLVVRRFKHGGDLGDL